MIENIINPLLYGEINKREIEKVGNKQPKYSIGEIVDLNTWVGKNMILRFLM